jgi:hypothetical protein
MCFVSTCFAIHSVRTLYSVLYILFLLIVASYSVVGNGNGVRRLVRLVHFLPCYFH